MNIKRLLNISIFCLPAVSTFCQEPSGAAGVINEIKASNKYIYAESTAAEWREASDNATDILRMILEDCIAEYGSDADVDEIMEGKKVIRARRSDLYRAFIYVEKPATGDSPILQESGSDDPNMLEVHTFSQIKPYISSLEEGGRIADYGKYSTLPEGDCYLFVYNREGEVVAIIRRDGTDQTNLRTEEKDDVSSYKGCGAIWFRIK